ncbi:hypothetical protein B0H13DRAFT_1675497 [Mycena leptocephala]|nr:hypothetical protein B0H13DRAFT_1675497 [Mycena leptocephala]
MIYVFTCRAKHPSHSATERPREKTGNGTSNLKRTAEKCDSERGLVVGPQASGPPYSVAAHRAIIAMRTATSNRPFNSVNDKYYKMEVELLRPGTTIPAPSTVSRHLNLLYLELSKDVRQYFTV